MNIPNTPPLNRSLSTATLRDDGDSRRKKTSLLVSGAVSWKQRYESVLRAVDQVVYERDVISGEMIYRGDVSALLGYTRAELSGGWCRWLQIIHLDDRQRCKSFSPGAGFEGETFHVEYRVIHKSGKVITLRESGSTFLDERTQRIQVTGILTDISEQRDLNLRVQHAQKMEAFGRLAGGVAHDFNNILTVIAGYTEILMLDLEASNPNREYIEEIMQAAERATALTSQLRAFSRLQPSALAVINLSDVVLELRKMMRRLIGEDIELMTHIVEGAGSVLADPRQIETILINLVVNARDAMPSGGRISLEIANVTIRPGDKRVVNGLTPDSYVQLAVKDTGTGMNETIMARIFEPFFTTKEIGRGTGLGLSTCQTIVKQNNAHIFAESVPGHGSTFRVFFPRVRKQGGQNEHAGSKDTAELPRGDGETILLVEDDLAVQKIYGTMLLRLGYHVLYGANGDEALRVAGQHPEIRLVITDMIMPLMGGNDLAERLIDILPNTKVIFTSGYASEPSKHSGSTRETAFLPKPISRDTLAYKLREFLKAE